MLTEYWLFASERVIPGLNAALLASVELIVYSAVYGAALGIVTGVLRVYGPKPVRRWPTPTCPCSEEPPW